ncbi:MAG: desulfoferrodoxin [Armatimonadetes bacterium]|nr:desulfoferrodoxin [Armatimonadota bacterium]
MSKKLDILKCEECGGVFEVVVGSDCDCAIKCGDVELDLLEAKTADPAGEKHVPVIEKTAKGFKVTVGSVPHPMTEEHYIQFIEVCAGNQLLRAYLEPGQAPEAEFSTDAESVTAREYCNLHGLWEA